MWTAASGGKEGGEVHHCVPIKLMGRRREGGREEAQYS